MPTLNWCYGAKTPDLTDAIAEQLSAAHKYRNKLCELEHAKRDRFYDYVRQFHPAYVETEKAVEASEEKLAELRDKIQTARKEQRTKKPKGMEGLQEEIKALRVTLKEQRAARKEAKDAAKENADLQNALKADAVRQKDDLKAARDESGLYWGTAAIVNQACASFSSGTPPKFARWTGEGQLAVQLQKGLPVDDMLLPDTRAYISGAGRKRTLHFRIGSQGRQGIYAQVPIIFHRPLPPGGKVKWVYLERRKMANQDRWTARLTIDVPAEDKQIDDSKWVSLHVGWHAVPSGLEVAKWSAHDGATGRLVLPNSHLDDYTRLQAIQQYRDLILRDAIELLQTARKGDQPLPDWMMEDTKACHAWKTIGRVAVLIRQMKETEFVGLDLPLPTTPVELSRRLPPRRCDVAGVRTTLETAGFRLNNTGKRNDYFEASRDGETYNIRVSNHVGYMPAQTKYFTLSDTTHAATFLQALGGAHSSLMDQLGRLCQTEKRLWQHHARLSKRISRRRKNTYRNFAAMLTDKYDVLFFSKVETAKLLKNSKPEDLTDDERRLHRQTRNAAVSDLLGMVCEKFPLRSVEVDQKNLTKQCSQCGELTDVDNKQRLCMCECGLKKDVDINALANTTARGHVLLKDGALLALQAAQAAKELAAKNKLKKMQDARRKKNEEGRSRETADSNV